MMSPVHIIIMKIEIERERGRENITCRKDHNGTRDKESSNTTPIDIVSIS